ncbi:hypothetical protein LJB86_04085 [Deltaproteobacteria bacterium OttesenSCG-928-M10]|nr:hypothetical protein [Deltaproteobacteria bacterium OttesenSCG-928-M10]
MNLISDGKKSGNRCGHDPQNPILSPPKPIPKGEGGLPRILSLAAERAKEWFWNPQKCPLLETNTDRQTRSERREAIQVVLEYLLSRLDLVTLCVGTPTLRDSFVDLSMNTIVDGTGLGQRRCERAIHDLKEAGFMEVAQPRYRNEEGKYFGLRAIRCLTVRLFEWLELGPMLARERARASQALKKRIAKYGRTLGDVVKRTFNKALESAAGLKKQMPQMRRSASQEISRPWYDFYHEKIRSGLESRDAQRQANERFNYPPNWSPGCGDPEEFGR